MMPINLVFACNDYRNGLPLGYTDTVDIEVGDDDIRLVGGRVTVSYDINPARDAQPYEGVHNLSVGRVKVPCLDYQKWYGNWCCDRASVRAVHALKIINYLAKKKDWHAEDAPDWFSTAFDVSRIVTPQQWKSRGQAA